MKETVSTVIPCYNAAPFLRETLDSVLAQTVLPLEVIVVDDGSTDDSAAIAESYGPPVRVIRQKNQGESVARNRGIDEAKGEWVAFLDADDLWRPTKLEKQIALIAEDVVCVHTAYYDFGGSNDVIDLSHIPADVRYSLEQICMRTPFNTSTLLVRRVASPRFPEWTQYAEDLIYGLELVRKGEIRYVAELLTGYRVHGKNQSKGPAVETYRHETFLRWLEQNASSMAAEEVEKIKQYWIKRLVKRADDAKWTRQWPHYWAIRRYLEQYRSLPEVAALVNERIYPPVLYRIKDRFDRWRASSKKVQ